jgi:radical SAM-linked protein
MRGCTRGCRFCHAGYFYRPVRERNPNQIIENILREVSESGWEEAALVSLSSSDYTCIRPLLLALHGKLKENGATISLPSLRVDSLDQELVQLINAVGKAGLTVAPEAGSQRLRNAINKNLTEADILEAVQIALQNGWQVIKLYFMIGLPGEEDEDIDAIVQLLDNMIAISRKKLQINVSLSPFVPKPFTPFQWAGMENKEVLLARALQVKHAFSRYKFVKVKYHQIESSMLEGVLTRSDAQTGKWLLEAYKLGAKFDGWHEYFDFNLWLKAAEITGFDWQAKLQPISLQAILPWQHIAVGVTNEYFKQEWQAAQNCLTTADCREAGCLHCGVCNEDIHIETCPVLPENLPSIITEWQKSWSDLPVANTYYRVFYSKMAELRFVPHLDLMRMLFRLVRRNLAPVAYTQGFNPHPKLSLGPPLPLGVEGENEFFDVVMARVLPLELMHRIMQTNMEGALELQSVQLLPGNLHTNWGEIGSEALEITPPEKMYESIQAHTKRFHEQAVILYTREKKGTEKVVDLKQIIISLEWDGRILHMQKRLRGAGIFDVLEQVFGIERQETDTIRIVRKNIKGE